MHIQSRFSDAELTDRLKKTDLVIADADGTLGHNSCVWIGAYLLTHLHYYKDSWLAEWAEGLALDLAFRGKDVLGPTLGRVAEKAKEDHKERLRLRKSCARYVRLMKYPGTAGFFRSLGSARTSKVILTRNMMPMGEAYRDALGFSFVIPEVADKREGIDSILRILPDRSNVLFFGNSQTDVDACRYLRKISKEGFYHINLTAIQVVGLGNGRHPDFDVAMPPNYNKLRRLVTA